MTQCHEGFEWIRLTQLRIGSTGAYLSEAQLLGSPLAPGLGGVGLPAEPLTAHSIRRRRGIGEKGILVAPCDAKSCLQDFSGASGMY